MPVREQIVSLAAVGTTVIVPPGNRINAVSVTGLTPGASFLLKLGNNPTFTVDDIGILKVGNGATANDAQQGLTVDNVTAQAGATARLLVSYSRPGERVGAAPEITLGN